MTLFNKKRPPLPTCAAVPQTAPANEPFIQAYARNALTPAQIGLFSSLRENVPVIDAAIRKLCVLTMGFSVKCEDRRAQELLEGFLNTVPVGCSGTGADSFLTAYFEQLLTLGTAVGEIVIGKDRKVKCLYNADLRNIELRANPEDSTLTQICAVNGSGFSSAEPVKYPDFTLLSVLSPEPGCVYGTSLLRSLPFVSSILMKIFNTVGTNWERVGNVRFAVTYKPQNDALDRSYARERATQIADEWSRAMQSGSQIKDFVAVGDVSIKVIGAENQIPDSDTPVRQMLEQIVAKTGIPPFMLGLSWSSTERMSSQQADILTSELEGYRRILTPVIERICRTFLRLEGYTCAPEIIWNDITLQDEVELARARLFNAQASKLELEAEAFTHGGENTEQNN
ncbi:MAG: serine/threonine protein phosphatase [Clostridiales bacterium]|nr:serine/threonine protein phosphatase [Clostridiales bacterium]